MNKRMIAATMLSLSAFCVADEDANQADKTHIVTAEQLLAPIALDQQTDIIAQNRMIAVMDRLNESLSHDMEQRFNEQDDQVATAGH